MQQEVSRSTSIDRIAIEQLYGWIDQHVGEIITALQGVLRIPSLEDTATPNAPFGAGCREALDYVLELCAELGMAVHDDSGYAGHAEIGSGSEMVAAIGHLDVVPEGDGWTYPPYGGELHDGYLYSRGSADDKGPTFAALYAAVAILKTGVPIARRIRIIFGCNEESGFGCVTHYWEVSKNERPVSAFTPDAGFPLIYAEKGIANLVLTVPVPESGSSLKLIKFTGGRRPNMVPDSAEAAITGTARDISAAAAELSKFWDKNVNYEIDSTHLVVRALGKSAHGARPEGGDNAVTRLAKALLTLNVVGWKKPLESIVKSSDTEGRNLGIAYTDEVAGPLTSNLGIASKASDGLIELTFNIRYPVTWSIQPLLERLSGSLDSFDWTLKEYEDQPPLYVPLDEEPVATLLRIYREETGDYTSMPRTMGGGTYARATPHAVAYGPGFPGNTDGPAHEPDERFAIETLVRACKIYARALYELANAPL